MNLADEGEDSGNAPNTAPNRDDLVINIDYFFEIAIDLFCIADTNGYFIKVNKGWQAVLGYSTEELENHRFLDFVHPNDMPATLQAIEQLGSQQAVINFVNRYRRKDGEYRLIEWRSKPEGNLIYASARDITERKQLKVYEEQLQHAQDELGQSEARYETIVSAMHEGVVFQLRDGTIETCNPAAEQILGLTADQIMERTSIDPVWNAIHEDGTPFPGDTHPAMVTLATGQPVSDVIMGVHKPDGTLIWISINTQPLIRPNETSPYGAVATFIDITGRKNAEIQALQAHLERERTQILTSFIHDVSHEFRTPLAIIQSSLYLMNRVNTKEKRHEKTEIIEQQIRRINQLVDMLIKMSQLESGVMLNLQRINLNTLVNMVATQAEVQAIKANLALHVIYGDSLPDIDVDPAQVTDALGQIIENALRFTPYGGLITLRTYQTTDNRLAIMIKDTGIGISPESLPHIFERFYRIDVAHTTAGFGLGLPIALAIVERHNGTVEVTSAEGKGTTVIIFLPITA